MIAQCYEALGDLHAAHYWFGRAVEENPGARPANEAGLDRPKDITVEHLLING